MTVMNFLHYFLMDFTGNSTVQPYHRYFLTSLITMLAQKRSGGKMRYLLTHSNPIGAFTLDSKW